MSMRALFGIVLILPAAGVAWGEKESKEVEGVHKAIASYVEAFNKGDAAAVAAHWAEDGEWLSPSGERFQGRAAILAEMEAYFAAGETPSIEISSAKVRLLAPTVAVEEGKARVVRTGEAPSETSYIAIHVKEKDQWRLSRVRETTLPTAPSNHEYLRDLEWMVGTWVDEGEEGVLETTCKWTKNKNFLLRSFRLVANESVQMEGTQVIGWDAAEQRVRSWAFDTDGGFAEGNWSRDGNRWIIKSTHTLSDGRIASSINQITYIDDDTCTWQSSGREIDGKLQPNIDPVVVRRKTTGE